MHSVDLESVVKMSGLDNPDCLLASFKTAGITTVRGVQSAPSKVGHVCGQSIYVVVAKINETVRNIGEGVVSVAALPGVTPRVAALLEASGITTTADLRGLQESDLTAIDGIGPTTAKRLLQSG